MRTVAQRYGVCVKLGKFSNRFAGPDPDFGCNTETREVFVLDHSAMRENPEKLLHEIVHCIVQPPGINIHQAAEHIILLQFEGAMARELPPSVLHKVLDYQAVTYLDLEIEGHYVMCVEDLSPSQRAKLWSKGEELCRQLRILDERNRVTWRWPDWSQLPNHKEIFAW